MCNTVYFRHTYSISENQNGRSLKSCSGTTHLGVPLIATNRFTYVDHGEYPSTNLGCQPYLSNQCIKSGWKRGYCLRIWLSIQRSKGTYVYLTATSAVSKHPCWHCNIPYSFKIFFHSQGDSLDFGSNMTLASIGVNQTPHLGYIRKRL